MEVAWLRAGAPIVKNGEIVGVLVVARVVDSRLANDVGTVQALYDRFQASSLQKDPIIANYMITFLLMTFGDLVLGTVGGSLSGLVASPVRSRSSPKEPAPSLRVTFPTRSRLTPAMNSARSSNCSTR